MISQGLLKLLRRLRNANNEFSHDIAYKLLHGFTIDMKWMNWSQGWHVDSRVLRPKILLCFDTADSDGMVFGVPRLCKRFDVELPHFSTHMPLKRNMCSLHANVHPAISESCKHCFQLVQGRVLQTTLWPWLHLAAFSPGKLLQNCHEVSMDKLLVLKVQQHASSCVKGGWRSRKSWDNSQQVLLPSNAKQTIRQYGGYPNVRKRLWKQYVKNNQWIWGTTLLEQLLGML